MTTCCRVPGFSLEIDKVNAIKAIEGTIRLPERMQFEMENEKRYIRLVEIVLTQDYKILVSVYNRIRKVNVLGRKVANDVQQRICQIRKEKANNEDLPTRMIKPNPTNRKIHFEPFYIMEFRDS